MRKKTLTLKQAKPALSSMIQDMKKKYRGRNVQFMPISTLPEDQLQRLTPNKVLKYLSVNNAKRMTGHINGIEFYYYKLQVNNEGLFIAPVVLFYIQRQGNLGRTGNRILACSLDAYLPRTDDNSSDLGGGI